MNKYVNITMAIAISAFLAVNLYLIFGDKSVIQKSVSVDEFERMSTDDFRVDLVKEALVAPLQTQTVYVGNENAVDSWLVTEGDVVNVGSELALLNIEQSEGRRSVLLSEQEILFQQEAEALDLISTLEYDRGVAASNSSTMTNKTDNVNSTEEDTTVEVGLNVDVKVDVSLDGSYAQAIATAEQNLADIVRRMVVVEAELAQDPSRPAIVSPVEGVVSKVTLRGSTLAVDIYSSEKVIVTYVQKNEWKDVVPGLKVLVHGVGTDGVGEGTVLSVSEVPAQDDEWLQAYKFLDAKKVENPLAYYEVRILVNAETEPGTEPEIETDINPYGTNLNAIVVLEEVFDALSIKADWVRSYDKGSAIATILDDSGRLKETKIISPFIWHDRVVVTDGLKLGDVAIDGTNIQRFEYDPRAFLTMPKQLPEKADWKSFGWRNYLMYMGLK